VSENAEDVVSLNLEIFKKRSHRFLTDYLSLFKYYLSVAFAYKGRLQRCLLDLYVCVSHHITFVREEITVGWLVP